MCCRLHDAPASPCVVPGKQIGSSAGYSSGKKRLMMDGGRRAGRLEAPQDGRREDGVTSGRQTAATRPQPRSAATTTITTGSGFPPSLLVSCTSSPYWSIWGAFSGAPPTIVRPCHRERAREWGRSALGTEI